MTPNRSAGARPITTESKIEFPPLTFPDRVPQHLFA